MWTADSFEHMLFITAEDADDTVLAEAMELIERHMEEQLVRKGEKVPEKTVATARGGLLWFPWRTRSFIYQRP